MENTECTLEFVGEVSSLEYLKNKICVMIKNKQENCIQFLLGNKFKDFIYEDGVDYEYSIYCGYASDLKYDEFDIELNVSSIILKFETFCFWDTLPYISNLCVKYKLDCKIAGKCESYNCYDFYILYKNGKYKEKSVSYDEGVYLLNPSSIYYKIKSDLIQDILDNRININRRDAYLKRYKYLNQKDKEWMTKMIDGIVASYSTEIFTNELPKATASI